MKLKRTRSRVYKGKPYYRWTIQIPPDQVTELKWPEGTDLASDVDRGVLRVRRQRSNRPVERNRAHQRSG